MQAPEFHSLPGNTRTLQQREKYRYCTCVWLTTDSPGRERIIFANYVAGTSSASNASFKNGSQRGFIEIWETRYLLKALTSALLMKCHVLSFLATCKPTRSAPTDYPTPLSGLISASDSFVSMCVYATHLRTKGNILLNSSPWCKSQI